MCPACLFEMSQKKNVAPPWVAVIIQQVSWRCRLKSEQVMGYVCRVELLRGWHGGFLQSRVERLATKQGRNKRGKTQEFVPTCITLPCPFQVSPPALLSFHKQSQRIAQQDMTTPFHWRPWCPLRCNNASRQQDWENRLHAWEGHMLCSFNSPSRQSFPLLRWQDEGRGGA